MYLMWWQDQLSNTVVEACGGRRVMALHEGPQRHMVEEEGDTEGVVEARDAGGATKMRQWCVVVERSRPQGNVVVERDRNRGVVAASMEGTVGWRRRGHRLRQGLYVASMALWWSPCLATLWLWLVGNQTRPPATGCSRHGRAAPSGHCGDFNFFYSKE